MNIAKENREDRTSVIRITVDENDYGQAVEKTLRDYRKKASIPGFRPGMVPMGIINRMYRKGTVAEESYRAASKACSEYIETEKMDIIGEILPSDDQGSFDFDNNTAHEFVFEVALAPEVNMDLSHKDSLTRYTIEADEKIYESHRAGFVRRYGKLENVGEISGKDELLTANLNNGQIDITDAYVRMADMDEKDRGILIGKKAGDEIEVDINELYRNPAQRAANLKVKEDELAGIDPKFRLTVTDIRRFDEPEMNGEFFRMAFPDGSVTDEEGFKAFIYGEIENEFRHESDFFFRYRMRKLLMDKAALNMPEAFLKKWLYTVNEGKFTMEQIEADFPGFLDMMRWNLIRNHFMRKFDIRVTEEEMLHEARSSAVMQFKNYGMANVEDELLTNYATRMLSDKKRANEFYDAVADRKVIEALIPEIKVTDRNVSYDEFVKIANELG